MQWTGSSDGKNRCYTLMQNLTALPRGRQQSMSRSNMLSPPHFLGPVLTSKQTPAQPWRSPPAGRTRAPQRSRRCSPYPDLRRWQRSRKWGNKEANGDWLHWGLPSKEKWNLWPGGPPPLDTCHPPTKTSWESPNDCPPEVWGWQGQTHRGTLTLKEGEKAEQEKFLTLDA